MIKLCRIHTHECKPGIMNKTVGLDQCQESSCDTAL